MATTTAAQAWAILSRHARDDIGSLRLQELCKDNDRVSSLVAIHNNEEVERMLLVDLSRQRITLETLNHLLRLANARGVMNFIQMLAWGQNNPNHPVVVSRQSHPRLNGDSYHNKHARFGERTTSGPTSPSMHMALRAPNESEMLLEDGTNALHQIQRDRDRVRKFSHKLRTGQVRGVTGNLIKDVIVIGTGTPLAALQFVYQALTCDRIASDASREGLAADVSRSRMAGFVAGVSVPITAPRRRLHFLTSADPQAMEALVEDLDAGATLVITIALSGQEETGMASRSMKNWLVHSLAGGTRKPDAIYSRHMILVTGNDRLHSASKPENVFLIPSHSRCEPFMTFSVCSLLPLSVVFGWTVVKQFIDGAHDLDKHFVETGPRHNIPLLLALSDLWNDAFLGSCGRFITPFTRSLEHFATFVVVLESQACGGPSNPAFGRGRRQGPAAPCCGLPIMAGSSIGGSSYDRLAYQGTQSFPSELIAVMDTELGIRSQKGSGTSSGRSGLDEELAMNQDVMMCAVFAHADELAFGVETTSQSSGFPSIQQAESFGMGSKAGTTIGAASNAASEPRSDGNRPSSLLIFDKLDAFACGQLISLTEHRAAIKAKLWEIDPFMKTVGASMRVTRTDRLRDDLIKLYEKLDASPSGLDEDEEIDGLNLSTTTLLRHYATRQRSKRMSQRRSKK